MLSFKFWKIFIKKKSEFFVFEYQLFYFKFSFLIFHALFIYLFVLRLFFIVVSIP